MEVSKTNKKSVKKKKSENIEGKSTLKKKSKKIHDINEKIYNLVNHYEKNPEISKKSKIFYEKYTNIFPPAINVYF